MCTWLGSFLGPAFMIPVSCNNTTANQSSVAYPALGQSEPGKLDLVKSSADYADYFSESNCSNWSIKVKYNSAEVYVESLYFQM